MTTHDARSQSTVRSGHAHDCPLCHKSDVTPFLADRRSYFRCAVCKLVFVPPEQFLSAAAEKAEYDKHENSAADPRYRAFLSRLQEPLLERLAPHSRGLDFGSGPGPTLSLMFEEAGHAMHIYDPFYAADDSAWQHRYDFITASEVVEHLHDPRSELDRLWSCLKPNGLLGIMTKRVIDRAAFSRWHYKDDPTHVCFFSLQSFRWLATHWQATLSIPEKDVVVFAKSS
ncbi:MAG: class I SAM-dependent methyltransferase [Planctomycetaceae bacterium]